MHAFVASYLIAEWSYVLNRHISDSILYQVERRIKAMTDKVILRSDINDLADYRQISRALNTLVKQKSLAKIGKGVYAKMRCSLISSNPVLDGAFTVIAREALDKLKVKWQLETAEQEYNQGKRTQVPAHGRVRLKSRFSRKIAWNGMELQYEPTSE